MKEAMQKHSVRLYVDIEFPPEEFQISLEDFEKYVEKIKGICEDATELKFSLEATRA